MKYLIYCGPGIGDWILILPMARRIKRSDPNAYILVIMTSDKEKFKINKMLLKLQNEIDDIDYYSMREKRHLIEFLIHVGMKKFDYGFVLQYTDNCNTSKWPCKIIRFASKKTCGMKVTSRPSIKYNFEIHRRDGVRIIDYPMLMLDTVCLGIGIKIEAENLLDTNLIEAEFKSLENYMPKKPIISLVVGTASIAGGVNGVHVTNPAKNWPYKYWCELAVKINASGYQVLLLGGNREKKELSGINIINKDIINLAGKCSIVESLALIYRSCLIIGGDTGLMHCAGALGIPSLTLFGCTDHREYLPFGVNSYYITSKRKCSPCFGTEKSLTCKEIMCMKEISVEEVYTKALTIVEYRI